MKKQIKHRKGHVFTYKSKNGFRFKIIGSNGREVAASTEAYASKYNARRAFHSMIGIISGSDWRL